MLWLSTALALDWWVQSEEEAAQVEAALAEVWPDSSVEVQVGAPRGDGLWTEEGQLVLLSEGSVRSAPASDVWTQAALARSWARELELETPPPLPELATPEPVVLEAPPPRFEWSLALGPGLRSPVLNPPVHAAFEARPAGWPVGLGFTADVGEVQEYRHQQSLGIATQRLGLSLPLHHRVERAGGTLDLALQPTARVVLRNERFADPQDRWLAAALGLRVRWWGPANGRTALGVGGLVTLDTPVASELGDEPVDMAFVTVHLEFCLIRGLP